MLFWCLIQNLVLHFVCRILAGPKARAILLNGAVRKGERLVPPTALDLLMQMTFPVPTALVKVCLFLYEMLPIIQFKV